MKKGISYSILLAVLIIVILFFIGYTILSTVPEANLAQYLSLTYTGCGAENQPCCDSYDIYFRCNSPLECLNEKCVLTHTDTVFDYDHLLDDAYNFWKPRVDADPSKEDQSAQFFYDKLTRRSNSELKEFFEASYSFGGVGSYGGDVCEGNFRDCNYCERSYSFRNAKTCSDCSSIYYKEDDRTYYADFCENCAYASEDGEIKQRYKNLNYCYGCTDCFTSDPESDTAETCNQCEACESLDTDIGSVEEYLTNLDCNYCASCTNNRGYCESCYSCNGGLVKKEDSINVRCYNCTKNQGVKCDEQGEPVFCNIIKSCIANFNGEPCILEELYLDNNNEVQNLVKAAIKNCAEKSPDSNKDVIVYGQNEFGVKQAVCKFDKDISFGRGSNDGEPYVTFKDCGSSKEETGVLYETPLADASATATKGFFQSSYGKHVNTQIFLGNLTYENSNGQKALYNNGFALDNEIPSCRFNIFICHQPPIVDINGDLDSEEKSRSGLLSIYDQMITLNLTARGYGSQTVGATKPVGRFADLEGHLGSIGPPCGNAFDDEEDSSPGSTVLYCPSGFNCMTTAPYYSGMWNYLSRNEEGWKYSRSLCYQQNADDPYAWYNAQKVLLKNGNSIYIGIGTKKYSKQEVANAIISGLNDFAYYNLDGSEGGTESIDYFCNLFSSGDDSSPCTSSGNEKIEIDNSVDWQIVSADIDPSGNDCGKWFGIEGIYGEYMKNTSYYANHTYEIKLDKFKTDPLGRQFPLTNAIITWRNGKNIPLVYEDEDDKEGELQIGKQEVLTPNIDLTEDFNIIYTLNNLEDRTKTEFEEFGTYKKTKYFSSLNPLTGFTSKEEITYPYLRVTCEALNVDPTPYTMYFTFNEPKVPAVDDDYTIGKDKCDDNNCCPEDAQHGKLEWDSSNEVCCPESYTYDSGYCVDDFYKKIVDSSTITVQNSACLLQYSDICWRYNIMSDWRKVDKKYIYFDDEMNGYLNSDDWKTLRVRVSFLVYQVHSIYGPDKDRGCAELYKNVPIDGKDSTCYGNIKIRPVIFISKG